MSTAIVILNWNGANYLQQFLPFLIQHTSIPDVEIIVADNASTDDSMKIMENSFSGIKTIQLDKNYGFAGGYNMALKQIESDYFVLLNSDVEITSFWLEPLIEFMNKNEQVAACQPKILSYYNRTHFEHAGAAGGFIDKYGFPFCRGRILGIAEEDKGQYNNIIDIFWATGACLMVRSKIFWEVGGLDDDFFAHMEEIDLCWRLKSRGFRIVCIPESSVYHIGGGTLSVENQHKTYLNFRNNLLLLYKNLPENRLKIILFWRFFFDYSAAFQLFVTGKFQNAISVIKARKEYHQIRSKFEAKRNENMSLTTNHDIPEILQLSIVLSYYLKGKKIYSDIFRK